MKIDGIKRPRVRGWLRVAEKPWCRFIVLVLCLHNINNNNVIIIVFNSFDFHIQQRIPETFDIIYLSMRHIKKNKRAIAARVWCKYCAPMSRLK